MEYRAGLYGKEEKVLYARLQAIPWSITQCTAVATYRWLISSEKLISSGADQIAPSAYELLAKNSNFFNHGNDRSCGTSALSIRNYEMQSRWRVAIIVQTYYSLLQARVRCSSCDVTSVKKANRSQSTSLSAAARRTRSHDFPAKKVDHSS